MRIFFRRIELMGLEHVPQSGAVVFAVNHPNGLIDPLFLLCFAPRPVSFLAKAPLFSMPFIRRFVLAFDTIPVYRRQEDPRADNRETFARARDLLARGGSLAIFPEGTSHSDPMMRELKTGAARIALGAALDSVVIVPAGIYYTAKGTFRSSALVYFGPAIPVTPAPVDERGEPPRAEVERLTDTIDAGLDAVTLQAESHQALDLIARAEDIFTAGEPQPLAVELKLRRRFARGYHYLRTHDAARLVRLASAIERFEAELGRARIEPEELIPKFDARTIAIILLMLPLGVAGIIIHYPAYLGVDYLARRLPRGDELVATVKFLASLLLYPITWVIVCAALWRFAGARYGLAAMIVLPLLGYIAMRLAEGIDEVIGRLRAVWHRAFGRRGYLQLIAQQNAIRAEIVAVAEEERAARTRQQSTVRSPAAGQQ